MKATKIVCPTCKGETAGTDRVCTTCCGIGIKYLTEARNLSFNEVEAMRLFVAEHGWPKEIMQT